MKPKIKYERPGKALKKERNKLVLELKEKHMDLDRKNMTVKQQVTALKKRMAGAGK